MKTSTFLALIVAALATPLAAQETYFGTCRGANGRCYTEATGTMTCTEGRCSAQGSQCYVVIGSGGDTKVECT